MCGIVGYYAFGERRPTSTSLERLFVASSSRGRDATGFGYIRGGKVICEKAPLAAEAFIQTPAWEKLVASPLPRILIGHTRSKTIGDPADNRNNHPVTDSSGWVLVHNGEVRGYKELEEAWKYTERGGAEVDTIGLLAAISTSRNLEEARTRWSLLGGTASVLALSAKEPDLLLAFADTSPLSYMYNPEEDILYLASTKHILEEANSYFKRGFLCKDPPGNIESVKSFTGLLIDKEGYKESFPIRLSGSWHTSVITGYRGNHNYPLVPGSGSGGDKKVWGADRREEHAFALPDEAVWYNASENIICPECFTTHRCSIIKIGGFVCPACGAPLLPPPHRMGFLPKKDRKTVERLRLEQKRRGEGGNA